MKLMMSPPSPFVRKVRILIREANLAGRVTEVPVQTTPLASDPRILAANPTGRIPVLVRDDGPALYDSRVITRYLDHIARAGLYPEPRLWEVLTLEATADAICDSAVLITYEGRLRPEAQQSRDWTDAHWTKIARALDTLETRWMSHLFGPLDMGQIALASALSYLDLRHDARGWRQGHPALDAWHARFAQRPSMTDTAPA